MPAYEWNFGDVNPPVHAWATLFIYRIEQAASRTGAIDRFLQAVVPQAAAQLHLVGEPQGPLGRNVFEGGFLGLDNIGVFDRSAPLPTGGHLSRPTAPPGWRSSARTCSTSRSSWRGDDPAYEDFAIKFVEHFSGSPPR